MLQSIFVLGRASQTLLFLSRDSICSIPAKGRKCESLCIVFIRMLELCIFDSFLFFIYLSFSPKPAAFVSVKFGFVSHIPLSFSFVLDCFVVLMDLILTHLF